jgi:large subunit ribosomal protein L21
MDVFSQLKEQLQTSNEPAPKAKAEAEEATPKAEAKEAAPKKETAKKAEPKKETAKKAAPKSAKGGDDLKKIEGIGPKIAELLGNANIDSYATLAGTDAEKIKEILAEAGGRYKSHDPTTWPQQAQLAADDKWDELKELQDNLKGGKPA